MTLSDEPDPARFVADADVLAADVLAGGDARDAIDLARAHSWIELVATDELLDDAEAVLAELASPGLAADWRELIEPLRVRVEQPPDDHPALASAYRGNAATILSFDETLLSAEAGVALRPQVATSVKRPDAFVRLVDPATLYEVVVGGEYPGPDRNPRG